MIALRKTADRHHDRRRKQEIWQSFRTGPLADGFGNLDGFEEDRLPPGGGAPRHAHRDAEILTYVREGAISQEDSNGHTGVIRAGEFQRISAGRGVRHSETNASRTEWAHVFRLWLHPSETGLTPEVEQKRFGAAERRGGLCLVASPDARNGSLRIHQDVLVYSALLDPGQEVVHELSPGRSAWLHTVHGELTIGDSVLVTGDGASVTDQGALSLIARAPTEILLLDLVG